MVILCDADYMRSSLCTICENMHTFYKISVNKTRLCSLSCPPQNEITPEMSPRSNRSCVCMQGINHLCAETIEFNEHLICWGEKHCDSVLRHLPSWQGLREINRHSIWFHSITAAQIFRRVSVIDRHCFVVAVGDKHHRQRWMGVTTLWPWQWVSLFLNKNLILTVLASPQSWHHSFTKNQSNHRTSIIKQRTDFVNWAENVQCGSSRE